MASRTRIAAAAVALAATLGTAAWAGAPAQARPPVPASPLTTVSGRLSGPGDLFLTPTSSAAGAVNGAQIVDQHNRTVWFHQAAAGTVDADFRTQILDGRPVLTFWEGTKFGGLSDGTDYIYDDHYREIAQVHAGPGLTTDGHEFLVTDRGTAWVLSYDTATADLTSIGGSAHQTVLDGPSRSGSTSAPGGPPSSRPTTSRTACSPRRRATRRSPPSATRSSAGATSTRSPSSTAGAG